MKPDFTQLTHAGIQALQPYQGGKPIEELRRELGIDNIIKLASNENPWGPSPLAIAQAQAALETSWLYPDGNSYELKQAIADHLLVSPNKITLGNGSDEVLALIAQVFSYPGCEIIHSEHGFIAYRLLAKMHHATPVSIPEQGWQTDLTAMHQAITEKTRIIFITNPNNPTGSWFNETALRQFLENVPSNVIVVCDEAYFEYMDQSDYPNSISLQDLFPNLIVTRTFSKAYAMAGFRLGYGISCPQISNLLNRVRLPFNVNHITQTAAVAALQDVAHLQSSVEATKVELTKLTEALSKRGFDYIPSVGNFVTVHFGQHTEKLYHRLLQSGIIVRPLGPYHLPEHLRITIGKPEQNHYFLTALDQIWETIND